MSQLESQQSELRAQLESAQATAAAITAQNEALRKTAQEQVRFGVCASMQQQPKWRILDVSSSTVQ